MLHLHCYTLHMTFRKKVKIELDERMRVPSWSCVPGFMVGDFLVSASSSVSGIVSTPSVDLYTCFPAVTPRLHKKKTFSAVGFGHDKTPFLSTQHKDYNNKKIYACNKKKLLPILSDFTILNIYWHTVTLPSAWIMLAVRGSGSG